MLNYGAEKVIKCRLAPRNGLLGFVFEGYCEESDLLRAGDRADINDQVLGLHAQYPDLSQAEIARQVGVNKMRVSRILAREGSNENA
jgi:predicted XRE-type DNA-binding protein